MQVEHSQRKGRRREEPAQAHAVSFITAVLMAVALCFHSILEVCPLFLLTLAMQPVGSPQLISSELSAEQLSDLSIPSTAFLKLLRMSMNKHPKLALILRQISHSSDNTPRPAHCPAAARAGSTADHVLLPLAKH